jgi:hypothetical protein
MLPFVTDGGVAVRSLLEALGTASWWGNSGSESGSCGREEQPVSGRQRQRQRCSAAPWH